MDSLKTSLHGFCKTHNLAKSSVSRKAKELGIDTSSGLSADDCDRLKAAFKVSETALVLASEVVEQPLNQPEITALSTRDFLASIQAAELPVMPTFKHVASSDRVSAMEGDLEALSNQHSDARNAMIQALVNQALEDGNEIGTLVAQVKIAASQRKESQLLGEYAKKQGLVVE